MAVYISTFTTLPISFKVNHSIQAKPSVELQFLIPMSRRHLSIPQSATQPQKYVYPDPIPQFAVAETRKFRAELLKKLSKEKETFGDELDDVVSVCAEDHYLKGQTSELYSIEKNNASCFELGTRKVHVKLAE